MKHLITSPVATYNMCVQVHVYSCNGACGKKSLIANTLYTQCYLNHIVSQARCKRLSIAEMKFMESETDFQP